MNTYWQAWIARCEREAERCEREAAEWRGPKLEYAKNMLAECDGQAVLL